MIMSSIIYLISGANRGIGLGLVEEIISKQPNAVVFAGTRDPAKSTDLQSFSAKHPGKVHVVKLVSADVENNRAVAKEIQDKYGRVDIVIANAAIGSNLDYVLDLPPEDTQRHFEVNVNGPIILFQAIHSLLRASSNPKFIPVSSGVGSMGFNVSVPDFAKVGAACYGASKAALNFIALRIHLENEWLTCFPLNPGGIRTDMWRETRENDKSDVVATLQDTGSLDVDEAAKLLVALITKSTRQEHGGKFVSIDGSILPW